MSAEAKVLNDVAFFVITKWLPKVDGDRWLHGVALAWHKGKLGDPIVHVLVTATVGLLVVGRFD